MKLWSDSFTDGSAIPGEFAFCVIDAAHHVKLSSQPQSASGLGRRAGRDTLVRRDLPRPRRTEQAGRPVQGGSRGARQPAARRLLPLDPDRHSGRDAGDRGRQLLEGSHAARQERAGGDQRHAPGHQRLHRLVRVRPRHERRLLRLRRSVSAVERFDRPSLRLHRLRARPRARSESTASSRRATSLKAMRGPRARARPR